MTTQFDSAPVGEAAASLSLAQHTDQTALPKAWYWKPVVRYPLIATTYAAIALTVILAVRLALAVAGSV